MLLLKFIILLFLSKIVNSIIDISPKIYVMTSGETVELTCTTNTLVNDVRWLKKGIGQMYYSNIYLYGMSHLAFIHKTRVLYPTLNQSRLILFNVSIDDVGTYDCDENNGLGNSASTKLFYFDILNFTTTTIGNTVNVLLRSKYIYIYDVYPTSWFWNKCLIDNNYKKLEDTNSYKYLRGITEVTNELFVKTNNTYCLQFIIQSELNNNTKKIFEHTIISFPQYEEIYDDLITYTAISLSSSYVTYTVYTYLFVIILTYVNIKN